MENKKLILLIYFSFVFSASFVHGQININFNTDDCILKNNAVIGNVILKVMGKDSLKILFKDKSTFNISFTIDSIGNVLNIDRLGVRRNISDDFLNRIAFVLREAKPQFYLCGKILSGDTEKKIYQLMKEWFFSEGQVTKNVVYGFPGLLRSIAFNIQLDARKRGNKITDFEAFIKAIQINMPTKEDMENNMIHLKKLSITNQCQ
ncbi:MAG: hypothetical protein Q8861_16280 [Bacteroidota bacterium]|nr:hypothetical protein [Bacteroidota bacterium]